MIKIAHEAPLCLMDKVDSLTDYTYYLVHLFEENEQYLQHARESVAKGRETILDNSIFELEEAFDAVKFRQWVRDLKPTWHIVPDVLEDANGTIDNMVSWMNDGKEEGSKTIGVVQGKTYDEICDCYYVLDALGVDMIAISFDYSLYQEWFPDEPTKYHSWMKGRQKLLAMMEADGVINRNMPHHLLGAGLPQEFREYEYPWIYSLDTSNPVVHGIKGIYYHVNGLDNKESVKLYTMMDNDVRGQWNVVKANINMFKAMTNA